MTFASEEMSYNFSSQKKFSTWRKLWICLAKAEKILGLDISDEQIKEMESNVDNVDFAKAAAEEKLTRHDVMAHVHVYAEQCPKAAPIIHLGATSCYVGDNTDLIVLRDGLDILLPKIALCISNFCKLIDVNKNLGGAQPTTICRKASIWIADLLSHLKKIEHLRNKLGFRGVKGTTGTQASFLSLFEDYSKVKQLDKLVTEMAGFKSSILICGQTYSRRFDVAISSCLSSLCDTVFKISTEISLLTEGKTNVLCKQCCSLSRLPISHLSVFLNTLSTQWLERTLDDSACRRISLAESFLCVDGMLETFQNVVSDLIAFKNTLEFPSANEDFKCSAEKIIITEFMKAKKDDQLSHEDFVALSQKAANIVKSSHPVDLVNNIQSDDYFKPIHNNVKDLLKPENFSKCLLQQVKVFLDAKAYPGINKY